MSKFFSRLLEQQGFMPHGHCYLWQDEVLWLHLIGDGLTVLAYFLIPAMLIYFVRVRKDLRYRTIFYLFGAFIISCGTTHLISVYTIWEPIYRLESLVKLLTGIISMSTTAYMLILLPKAKRIPTVEQLEAVNHELAEEVISHRTTMQELQASQVELQRRLSELKALNDELEGFIYSVSHDLRAPIRHVNSHALQLEEALASDEPEAPEAVQMYLNDIKYTAKRMGGMMDELLNFSRGRNQPLTMERIDLDDVVKSAQAEALFALPKHDIEWHITELPTIQGDYNMIHRVFENLLSNAIKFTGKAETPRIDISVEEKPQTFEVSVRDNGAGFNMKYKEKLFGLFQRLHKQSDYPGYGVGLANVKRIIERHGGAIEGRGERGKGAEFILTFPKPQSD